LSSVALSADGRWALSGSHDNTLCLWELSSGECLKTLGGDPAVSSVALSADGRWALSGGCEDKTLRLWELSGGKCLKTFEGHTSGVGSVTLSADGCWALSGSHDNTLRLWQLDWNYEFPDSTDWDEGARPYLEIFLCQHTPYAAELPVEATPSDEQIQLALTRRGKPTWTEQGFQHLITQLQHAGFGWIRPEGVKRELERMAAEWQLGENDICHK
jgi:WD40 repeat protein